MEVLTTNKHTQKQIDLITKSMIKDMGYRIRKIRKDKRISQQELAYFVNTNAARISDIERGMIENVTLRTVVKIAMFLEVDVIDIMI